MKKKRAIFLALIAAFLLGDTVLEFIVDQVAQRLNRVAHPDPYEIDEKVATLHRSLFIADLHTDALLWNRDLLERSAYGHLDLPRLRQGNVALQVFSAVTQIPWGINPHRNPADSDLLFPLVLLQRWPLSTWTSPMQRALYQARKLEELVQRANDLILVRSRSDLATLLERRQRDKTAIGAVLSLEGTHALEGKAENLEHLFAAGYRILGLAHFADTEVAGSTHGEQKGGLTPFGRRIVRRAQDLGMVIDLAHTAPQTIEEVAALTTAPLIVSHTGVQATCDSPRNLSDAHLRAIAGSGGVVGIALFPAAICAEDLDHVVTAMLHAVHTIGAAHVALGTDFDGAVTTPIDAAGLAQLTGKLLDAGLSKKEIESIMGTNVLHLLDAILPK